MSTETTTVTIGEATTVTITADTGPRGPAGGGGAGGVSDGDKGDITVTSSGTVWTIDAGAVTAAKVAADVATQAELDTHAADTTTHGTTGDIVGTSDTQTLTNKTVDSFTNSVHADTVHRQVRNDSGATITKGTPVYVSGYNVGQELATVDLADATSAATMPAIGLVTADIANNADGSVELVGDLEGVDTSSFSVGDELYVSETAGTLTTTAPNTTALVQKVGTVVRSHASLGVIDVAIDSTAEAYASETVYGVARLATDAETVTGTATDRVVTPANAKAAYQPLPAEGPFVDGDKTKLDGIETGATADQTAADIRGLGFFDTTNDGTGSGLDADLLDGNEATAFATAAQGTTADSAMQDLVDDTTPQLGGNLDLNGNVITGLVIGTDVQAYDVDTLKADTGDQLTAGFSSSDYAAGTQSSGTYTPNPEDGNFQTATNGGAHTLAPPTNSSSIIIHYTNNGSAGAITTSGFTVVNGDAFTTTNADEFIAQIVKINDVSTLTVTALQ